MKVTVNMYLHYNDFPFKVCLGDKIYVPYINTNLSGGYIKK